MYTVGRDLPPCKLGNFCKLGGAIESATLTRVIYLLLNDLAF